MGRVPCDLAAGGLGREVSKIIMNSVTRKLSCSVNTVSSLILHSNHISANRNTYFVGYEVLKTVVMKISVFRDIKQCIPLKVNQRLGGTCSISASCWFLVWLIFWPLKWMRNIPPKLRLIFIGLRCVISQQIEILITIVFCSFLSYSCSYFKYWASRTVRVLSCRYDNRRLRSEIDCRLLSPHILLLCNYRNST
jgi:hypothetical protein